MKITHYTFGAIDIDNKSYHSDVIVTTDRVKDNWWRKDGHNLAIEDLTEVITTNPDVVIIGTGYYGRMKVPKATQEYLQKKGIRFEMARTMDAVKQFNQLQKDCAKVVAALHLTC
ncbi:Mth938-like domain-containing protein [Kaarinaea lacus]